MDLWFLSADTTIRFVLTDAKMRGSKSGAERARADVLGEDARKAHRVRSMDISRHFSYRFGRVGGRVVDVYKIPLALSGASLVMLCLALGCWPRGAFKVEDRAAARAATVRPLARAI